MSVYVDNARLAYGRMIMCHMTADSTAELLWMADRIGVDRKWLQQSGTRHEHFDVCLARRKLAVKLGAVELTIRALVAALAQEKPTGEAICPDCEGLGCGKYAPNIPCLRCGGRGDVDADTIRPGEDRRLVGGAALAQEES